MVALLDVRGRNVGEFPKSRAVPRVTNLHAGGDHQTFNFPCKVTRISLLLKLTITWTSPIINIIKCWIIDDLGVGGRV